MEKDRFERMKVNQLLPDHLIQNTKKTAQAMDKAQDCTAHFTRMVEEYKQ